ncbi:MAG: cyclic nucleotide-binding domain-containing protein [Polyangiaceae bacterium]|nr:cyclic nucleotide-binding domain-containing protein [Polyangiaceae bacterium]
MHDSNVGLPTEQRQWIERELFLRAFFPVKPPAEAAHRLAQMLRDRHVKAGDVLFEQGDRPQYAYYIASGEVRMHAPDRDDLVFDANSLIGIVDLNIGRPCVWTAVATKDSHVLELHYPRWLEILEDFPDFTAAARRFVATGLHELVLSFAPTGGFDQTSQSSAPAADSDIVSRVVMLRRLKHFDTATVQSIAEVAARGEILTPAAGELVIPPGTSRERLLLVMRGTVHVERRIAPFIRGTFGPGQIVLDGAAFSSALSSYAVVAGAGATIFAIDHAEIDDIADDHFALVRSMMRGSALHRDNLIRLRRKSVNPSAT